MSIGKRLIALLFCALLGAKSHAAEIFSALDLVAPDAAFCLEIPHLDETWADLEKNPMFERLRGIPGFELFFQKSVLQRWRTIEERVLKVSTESLSNQTRHLFANSLVLAIYVTPSKTPQGILVGEALDSSTINTFYKTLNALEPEHVAVKKTYHDRRYIERKRNPQTTETLYFASSDRWFAVSDQESLIQDVIDRFVRATASSPPASLPDSLRQSEPFVKNRKRLKAGGAAYMHINARHWDGSLEESSTKSDSGISPAQIWERISSVAARLDFQQGMTCNSIIEFDINRLPSEWSQFVSTAAVNSKPSTRIPAEAIVGFNGHLELTPFIRVAMNQVPFDETSDFSRMRRIAQSLFGGQDLFQTILPALARDVHGFVVPRKNEQGKAVSLDGKVVFALNSAGDAKILGDLQQGLETGLNLLAAYYSSEGKDVIVVNREQTETTQYQWLSEAAACPIAIGTNGQKLVLTGSRDLLGSSFSGKSEDASSRLSLHSQRFFPDANQLIWFDLARIRQLLDEDPSVIARFLSPTDSKQFERQLKQWRPVLNVADSMYIAGRIESDHLHLVFGSGLDSR